MSADDLSLDSSDAIGSYDDHAEALVERPGLENVHRLGISFDFVLLNAVWHACTARRPAARFPQNGDATEAGRVDGDQLPSV
jgi:hypothetical protein